MMAPTEIINSAPTLFDARGPVPVVYVKDSLNKTLGSVKATTGSTPVHMPSTLAGPLVWTGSDYPDSNSYSLCLTPADVEQVEKALEAFKALGLDGDEVAKSNFPLPNLAKRLQECSDSLYNGRGFFVVKGIDMTRYSVEDGVVIYLGIASHIGDTRGIQDRQGNVLTHITSSIMWDLPLEKRHGIHSNSALPFHNDMGCDILALQVRQAAHKGGSTFISSTASIFNQLLKTEPAVVRTLFEPNWPIQYTGRTARHYLAPAMVWHHDRLMTSMDPNRFGPHPSISGSSIPVLDEDQKYALKKVNELAASMELQLDLARGDILFLNNWAFFHRRDKYDDDEMTSRHLVRLWLRNTEHGWPVSSKMMPPWQTAYGNENQSRIYALYPLPKYSTPKYSVGSAAFLIEDDDDDESDQ